MVKQELKPKVIRRSWVQIGLLIPKAWVIILPLLWGLKMAAFDNRFSTPHLQFFYATTMVVAGRSTRHA
jgi:hypothetical protein